MSHFENSASRINTITFREGASDSVKRLLHHLMYGFDNRVIEIAKNFYVPLVVFSRPIGRQFKTKLLTLFSKVFVDVLYEPQIVAQLKIKAAPKVDHGAYDKRVVAFASSLL